MRRPQAAATSVTSTRVSVQAPIGGWNARDPLSSMKETDAIELENWFPKSSSVELRKGYSRFATIPEAGHTLMVYRAPNGVETLFAASALGIYNVTAGGAITGAPATPLTSSSSCQFTMITTAGGSFLWCCNGVDKPRYWNGTAWVLLDGTSTPALTGISDSKAIVNVSLFKSRLFFILKDSLSFWYLPVNSVAGAAAEFPLGALFRQGGYIVAATSHTIDGGDGPDDRFIVITSKGEVAVYTGTDPANASTWALTGIYQIAPPIGRKCFARVEGDLAILTAAGVLPFSKALSKSNSGTLVAITDKIDSAFNWHWQEGRDLAGWQMLLYPSEKMLIINIPLKSGVTHQFVLNTATGAWCKFVGLTCSAMEIYSLELYSISGRYVNHLLGGASDNGDAILARFRQAYTGLKSPNRSKHVKMLQLPLVLTADMNLKLALDKDYESTLSTLGNSVSGSSDVSRWDSARWDIDRWVGEFTNSQWRKVACQPGFMISLRSEVSVKDASVAWTVTHYIYETGGIF